MPVDMDDSVLRAEAVRLVDDLDGDGLEAVKVRPAVVCAEEKFGITGESGLDECLRTAAVTAVGGGQSWCNSSGHVGHSSCRAGTSAGLPSRVTSFGRWSGLFGCSARGFRCPFDVVNSQTCRPIPGEHI